MPREPASIPPETRPLLTYDEAASWWTANHRPISARALRRVPLQTRLLGRQRLIEFESLRAAAAAELASPPVLFQAADAVKRRPRLIRSK
jgi:hypothetical protein